MIAIVSITLKIIKIIIKQHNVMNNCNNNNDK